jgi:hypothetical protein
MRTSLLILDQFYVLLKRRPAVKHRRPDIWQVLAESRVLVLDLKGEFAGMAEDKHRDFPVDGLDLPERGKDENCSFSEAGFRLAEDVGGENGLGEADLLDFGRMFETFSGGLVFV